MCLKIHHYLKYDKSKNSAKYHKILMSRFWEMEFSVPLLFSPISKNEQNRIFALPKTTDSFKIFA